MLGCEFFVTLLAARPVDTRDLKLGIDLLANDIGNQQLVVEPDADLNDYLFQLLNEHPEIQAVKIGQKIIIQRRKSQW